MTSNTDADTCSLWASSRRVCSSRSRFHTRKTGTSLSPKLRASHRGRDWRHEDLISAYDEGRKRHENLVVTRVFWLGHVRRSVWENWISATTLKVIAGHSNDGPVRINATSLVARRLPPIPFQCTPQPSYSSPSAHKENWLASN